MKMCRMVAMMVLAAGWMQVQGAESVAPPAPGAAGKRQVDPAVARSNMLARTGGMVVQVTPGPVVVFRNAQRAVDGALVDQTAEAFSRATRLPVSVVEQAIEGEPVAAMAGVLADKKSGVVIALVDRAGQPSLLVAPENRWAIVNVAALKDKGVSPEVLRERVGKELWRAAGYVLGAAHSNFEHCVLKPVLAPQDLDGLKAKTLCPEPFGQMTQQAQKLGITPNRMTTYRKAVEEGWAATPTNGFQQAIWDEVKKAAK